MRKVVACAPSPVIKAYQCWVVLRGRQREQGISRPKEGARPPLVVGHPSAKTERAKSKEQKKEGKGAQWPG